MKWLIIGLKCVAAGGLVGVGTVLLVLPGPGLLVIASGIAVLATEFAWAARVQARLTRLLRWVVRQGSRWTGSELRRSAATVEREPRSSIAPPATVVERLSPFDKLPGRCGA